MTHKTQKKWDKAVAESWQKNLRPPWRPSKDDIGNYAKGLKMIGSPKNILILGATPELRDLAASFGKKIWVADYSLKMISEMGKLMKGGFKKEKWISGDWCSLKTPGKTIFSVVLGDLVLRLINPGKQLVFLKKIRHLLSPGGFFITRIHFVKGPAVKLSTERIINDAFLLLDPHIPGRGTLVKNLLISRILDKNYFLGDFDKAREKARTDVKNYLFKNIYLGSNRKTILQGVLNRLTRRRLAPFFLQTEKEIEKKLKILFKIKRKLIADDYKDAKFFPVYILKPRTCA